MAVLIVAATKVGVLQFFSWPERRVPLDTVYERALQRIVTMDEAGYDAVWLSEDDFTTYSVSPSVHLMALEAAHRTHRIRIGTAVPLAALYDPLRLAEDVPLLDVLTGGRVNWEPAADSSAPSFEAFGVLNGHTALDSGKPWKPCLLHGAMKCSTFHGEQLDFDHAGGAGRSGQPRAC